MVDRDSRDRPAGVRPGVRAAWTRGRQVDLHKVLEQRVVETAARARVHVAARGVCIIAARVQRFAVGQVDGGLLRVAVDFQNYLTTVYLIQHNGLMKRGTVQDNTQKYYQLGASLTLAKRRRSSRIEALRAGAARLVIAH